jgi:hypothetical protein
MSLRFARSAGSAAPMLCFSAAMFLLVPIVADAGTLYCVSEDFSTFPCSPSSSTPVTGSPSFGSGGFASAAAGEPLGSSQAGAGGNASAGESEIGFSSGETSAAFSGDEVVFSGPSGGATLTSLNLTLNGGG